MTNPVISAPVERPVCRVEAAQLLGILDAIQSREIHFRMLNAALKSQGLPTAKGWIPLREKFRTPPVLQKDCLKWLEGLEEIYANTLLYSDKAIAVFQIEPTAAHIFYSVLSSLVDESSDFLTSFPMPLQNEDLKSAPMNPAGIEYTEEHGVGRLWICSKRYFTARFPLDTADFDENIMDAFSEYDELIGVKRGVYQAFDFLLVRPTEGRVEIHLDLSSPMNGADIRKAFAVLQNQFLTWAQKECGIPANAFRQRNFFPLVELLYNDQDGQILKMDHATSTGSVKSERMRRHGQDLRHEDFHRAGMEAVAHTDGYGITKEWSGPSGISMPGVIIPGHAAMAGADGATIGYAIVRGCADETDFEMVMSKLETA